MKPKLEKGIEKQIERLERDFNVKEYISFKRKLHILKIKRGIRKRKLPKKLKILSTGRVGIGKKEVEE